MESELATLAATGAATVVALLVTDSWEEAKTAVGSLWRRVRSDQAQTVVAELGSTRAALLSARAAEEQQVASELTGAWQGRLEQLLETHPQLATELRRIIADELSPALAASTPRTTARMRARASGQGRIYQAGRDLHITEG